MPKDRRVMLSGAREIEDDQVFVGAEGRTVSVPSPRDRCSCGPGNSG